MLYAKSLGKIFGLFSVGPKIWYSSDSETWMMTIDHIKPTIKLIPCSTYYCDVEFKELKETIFNVFYCI